LNIRTIAFTCQFAGLISLFGCDATRSASDISYKPILISKIQSVDLEATTSATKNTSADTELASMYSERIDRGFRIPAVDTKRLNPEHVRQAVSYSTDEPPGTVIVDQGARFLYYVLPGGRAMRYAVGVGPASRSFHGTATIAHKRAWPRWTPTANMIKRNPEHYGRFRNGVEGGPNNPMGARALYIHKDGQDTYYRIHGTNAPSSIGKAVSAGCIRLLAHDIIDLHDRVRPGARVVVR
jgi:lipoprotein-anchoring transpeptidase ErfK/SrfK